MSDFKAKVHKIRFLLGLRSRHRCGAYSTSPDPWLYLRVLPLREGGGKGKGEGEDRGERRGKRGGRLHHDFWGDGQPASRCFTMDDVEHLALPKLSILCAFS